MLFDIYTSFKFALSITSIIPCLIIIVIYLIDIKTIKFSSYFKSEIILSILILSCVNFFEIYDVESNTDSYKESNSGDKNDYTITIQKIRNHIQITLSCLLTSFSLLCYILLKGKKKGLSLSIFLSFISWFLNLYLLLEDFNKPHEDEKDSINFIYLISIIITGILFLLDLIFYILSMKYLHSLSKKDREKKKNCHTMMKRISLYFLSHFIYFGIQIFYWTKVSFDFLKIDIPSFEQILLIVIIISLNILSIINLFEPKTREIWDKFIKSLKLQRVKKEMTEETEENEEEEDSEDDYDEENDVNLKMISESE